MFITVHCPECNEETEHDVVTESRDLLVRCTTCGHHQRIKKDKEPRSIMVKTIVSKEGSSLVCGIELAEDDECSVGDHLVAECGEEAFGVEVSSIESGERRVNRAKAPDITASEAFTIASVVTASSFPSFLLVMAAHLLMRATERISSGSTCMPLNLKTFPARTVNEP